MTLLLLLLLPASGTEATTRAEELAALRREVETRSTDLLAAKEDLRNRLRAIEAQKLDIEVQLRREELRLAQLQGEAEARRAELEAHGARELTLAPATLDAIAATRAVVAEGLPFHLAERLAELDLLRDQVESGVLRPPSAVARLWAFTEDELRLARENGLERQVVPLPEGEVLADVARLGMAALYFRTDGDVVGCAERGPDGAWAWRRFTSREEALAVAQLFQKLQHGVRNGEFTLPSPRLEVRR